MNPKEKLKAQLVLVCGFAVLYLIFKQRAFLYVAIGVTFVSLFIPFLGDLILKAWFKLAEFLGWINSRILLSLVFIIFVVPVAIIKKLFVGKSKIVQEKEKDSFYSTRNHKYTPEDLKNLW